MTLQTIGPAAAKRLIDEGALLVDVREPNEHARERVPGARNAPLSSLDGLPASAKAIVFHCRSGARTSANAARLAAAAGREAYILEGGIDAWKKAGLPVVADRGQPIEIMRHVPTIAGALVLLGILLGIWVAPVFLALSGFVGASLMFAGLSGRRGLARLAGRMPWNRPGPARAAVE